MMNDFPSLDVLTINQTQIRYIYHLSALPKNQVVLFLLHFDQICVVVQSAHKTTLGYTIHSGIVDVL